MKTWLATTLISFMGPVQGAARLYGYLTDKGFDVSFKDLNNEIYFKLLSSDNLGDCMDKIKSMIPPLTRNKFLREDMGSIILNNSNNRIKDIIATSFLMNKGRFPGVPLSSVFRKIVAGKMDKENIVYALLANRDYVLTEIDRSLREMDSKFLSLPQEEFIYHFQNLLCGKAIIDAIHYPSQLDFGLGFQGTEYRMSAPEVIRAAKDNRHNFLIPYYKNNVMPDFEKERPDLVGISITHTSELIPAFTLAMILKEKRRDVHICLGGATVTEIAHRIVKNKILWECIDSIVLGPGEEVFSELITALDKKADLSGVLNLIFKGDSGIRKSDKISEFDINNACTPKYSTPRPGSVLPLETSSGCYWGKCIFCYYPKEGVSDALSCQQNVRTRKIELVLKDLEKLKEEYNPSYIGITDSSLSPRRIHDIAEWNINKNVGIKFSAFIRFEKEFTSASFCEKIKRGGFIGGQTGLETGSQRVNDLINKGTSLSEVKTILRNFYKTGILLHIYSIVGVPGETIQETRKTYKFFRRFHKYINLDWQVYPLRILEHGPLAMKKTEFRLELTPIADEFLFQVMDYKIKDGISQEESVRLSIIYTENLKKYLNPLSEIMDIETYKGILLKWAV